LAEIEDFCDECAALDEELAEHNLLLLKCSQAASNGSELIQIMKEIKHIQEGELLLNHDRACPESSVLMSFATYLHRSVPLTSKEELQAFGFPAGVCAQVCSGQ